MCDPWHASICFPFAPQGVKAVEQEMTAKIGVFIYWKDATALAELKSLGEKGTQKSDDIFLRSQPKFILPDLKAGSVLPVAEDFAVLDDTLYCYASCAGSFHVNFFEPLFPCEPAIEVPLRVKLIDHRYQLSSIQEPTFTMNDKDHKQPHHQQSCIAAKHVISRQGWTIKGLPFNQLLFREVSVSDQIVWQPSQANPTTFMQEESSDEPGFKSSFTATFLLERHSTTSIINFLLPSSLLSFLAFFTTFLPVSEFQQLRISTCTTLLLTLLALQLAISSTVPNTGSLTFLDRKMMCR